MKIIVSKFKAKLVTMITIITHLVICQQEIKSFKIKISTTNMITATIVKHLIIFIQTRTKAKA